MDKKTAEEIERAICERLDRLLTAGGSSTTMTVGFMIEAAKTEVAIVMALYKL